MTKRVQIVGHDTAGAATFVGRDRELSINTDTHEIRVHDGVTPGGIKVLTESQVNAKSILTGTGLSGGGDLSTNRTISLTEDVYYVGGTDVAVADGGTGASTAADARTNLGLGSIATQAASAVAITGGSVTGITDLTVADGGTGASDAATARTNLNAASLAGNTFTGEQILSDQIISRAMLKDSALSWFQVNGISVIDYRDGSTQFWTPSPGVFTLSITNWPPTSNTGILLIEGFNLGVSSITWPVINWLQSDGTYTTSIVTYLANNGDRTALKSSGSDFFLFWTRDAGSTIYGKLV